MKFKVIRKLPNMSEDTVYFMRTRGHYEGGGGQEIYVLEKKGTVQTEAVISPEYVRGIAYVRDRNNEFSWYYFEVEIEENDLPKDAWEAWDSMYHPLKVIIQGLEYCLDQGTMEY